MERRPRRQAKAQKILCDRLIFFLAFFTGCSKLLAMEQIREAGVGRKKGHNFTVKL